MAEKMSPGATADQYKVATGDTLSGIAKKHGLKYQDIAKWNNIQDPRRIQPGQTLRLHPPA
jgi:LysM repeat protein